MALVEFYIRDYLENGQRVQTETLFQTIPQAVGSPTLVSPKIKGSMGKAGSLDFSLWYGHPLYNALRQYKTQIRIVYAGYTLFRGRVLTIDKTFDRTRTVHCEGFLSVLLDSHQEGTKEEKRPTITVPEYLQQLIDQHNRDVEEEKRIVLGEVPGHYTSAVTAEQQIQIPEEKAKQQFGNSSWNTTMDRLEDLLNDFGGYLRIRYENGVSYLDWLDKYYNADVNDQSISLTSNMLDLSGTTEIENIFTVVIPIGKKGSENVFISDYWPTASEGHATVNYIEVPELATLGLYSDEELNRDYHRKSDYANAISKYGRVWKPVDFENANTPEKLFTYAKDWIKNNYMPELTQWSVTAIDLKITGDSDRPLIVGDRVPLTHPEVDSSFDSYTIIEAEYDLYDMDKSKYVIGVPNQQVNASYGVKAKNGGKGGGLGSKSDEANSDNEPDANLARLRQELLTQYSLKADWKQDIQLDDPKAFLAYNTRGEALKGKEVAENLSSILPKYLTTQDAAPNRAEMIIEANRRGVPLDDPQLVIDFTPNLKEAQTKWKQDTEIFMVNNLSMTEQEAHVLLNNSSGSSWLAGLVDDDGNWTEAARKQGWGSVRAHSAEVKEMATNTRKILDGSRTLPGTEVLNGVKRYVVGTDLNLTDFLHFDSDNLNFDLGSLFSVDGVKNIFKLISNSLSLDGEEGTAGVGWKDNKWQVYLNDTVTYTDIDGNEQTMDGFVSANDFNLPEVPSLKTRFAYISTAYIEVAYIDKINANEATIGEITGANIIEGTRLSADKAYFSTAFISKAMVGNNHADNYYLTVGEDGSSEVSLGGCYNDFEFSEFNGTITLKMKPVNGGTSKSESFDMASTTFYKNAVEAAERKGAATKPSGVKRTSSGEIGTKAGDVSGSSGKYVVFKIGTNMYHIIVE